MRAARPLTSLPSEPAILSSLSEECLSSQAARGWLHPTVAAIRWEEGKQQGQVPTPGEGAGDRISRSGSDPAGSRNVGLENVTLDSGPSPISSLLGGLIPGEQPFSSNTTGSWEGRGQGTNPEKDNTFACPPPPHPPAG